MTQSSLLRATVKRRESAKNQDLANVITFSYCEYTYKEGIYHLDAMEWHRVELPLLLPFV